MNVELSKHELDLLDKALDAYERESASTGLSTSLITMMLASKEGRDEARDVSLALMKDAELDSRQRRYQTTLIRAKLYQAQARESEHALDAIDNPLNP